MSDPIRRRIRTARDGGAADPTFVERLLERVRRIEAEFEGDERERLLALAGETLERHLQLRESSARTRQALAKLRADQTRIVEALASLTERPRNATLH